MTSPGQIKRTHVLSEEGQKSSGRKSPLVENVEPLTETVKSLAERFERLEALVQKISATEGKTYRVNSVLHLQLCIKER